MDKELYFHRCFVRTDFQQSFPRYEPLITGEGLLLFVEEAIEYIFRSNKIDNWSPEAKISDLRCRIPEKIYFNPDIGYAINHQCAIDDACRFAEEDGFDVNQWLKLTFSEAREPLERGLEVVRAKTRPVNLSTIHMLAFAGHLSRLAMQSDRADLITVIIWRVIHVFTRRFPLEWIYFDIQHWAKAYNVRHYEIHEKLIMEDPFQEAKPEYKKFAP